MDEMLSDQEEFALLWTGGWDSTFQLLQLLVTHRRRVTPFYLIDAERLSTGVEIRTMKRIKDYLLKHYPYTRDLLRPTRYFAVADISPDPTISEAFRSILKKSFMGSQYDWLPRFCNEHGITDIQLCIHRDDKAHRVVDRVVSECTDGTQTIFRVDPKYRDEDEHVIFRYFTFPIFDLSKVQMSSIANEQGWGKIMNMTWFCFEPTRDMKPCGKCNPCIYTFEEGLRWRFPLKTRIVAFLYGTFVQPQKARARATLSRLGVLKYFQNRA